jgi:hypothetical protein
VLKVVVAEEEQGKMKPRRGTEMTPPPNRVCFMMLTATICFVLAVAQTSNLEALSAESYFTDTTQDMRKYTTGNLSLYICEQCRISDRGEFKPRQTRQLPRAVDLKGRFLFLLVVKC